MTYSVEILDATRTLVYQERITLTPRNWDAEAIGGPSTATIDGSGDVNALWTAAQWMGYHARIRNENKTLVWWGTISAVQILTGGASVTLTLDDLRNRINVDYSYDDSDGASQSGETGWAEDAASVAAYGKREERVPLTDVTPAIATTRRNTWLKRTAAPGPMVEWSSGKSGLRLECRGYWSLLENVYYINEAGREVYDAAGNVEHMLGWKLAATWSIGFNNKVAGYRIHDLLARLYPLTAGTKLDVTGTTWSNGSYTIEGTPSEPEGDFIQLGPNTAIFFSAADEIYGPAGSFEGVRTGEMIAVTGTSDDVGHEDNNGYWYVQTTIPDNIEVNDGTRFIKNSATGQPVVIQQGHSVQIAEWAPNENPTASTFTLRSRGVRVAQSFQLSLGTAWTAHEIMVRVRKEGATHPNALLVGLYSDSAGSPNTLLASGSLPAADVRTVMEWVTVPLGTPYTLQPATTYWVAVSGYLADVGAETCYVVGLNDNADTQYAGGACKIQIIGGAWETRWGKAVSMPFQIWNSAYTTAQVQAMVAYAMPGFVTILRTSSGALQRAYRDGKQRTAGEVRDMIDTGDGNGNRIAVTVTPDSIVVIDMEAPIENADIGSCLHYDALTGELRRADGGPAEPGMLPAGQVVFIDNTETAGALLAQTRRMFVERASYDAENERLTMEPRGRRAPWELTTVG